MSSSFTRLSKLSRFYVYGLQGIFTEVIYTAIWDFVTLTNWKFIGVSSSWAFLIYAASHIFIEEITPRLISLKFPLFARAFVYLIWTYFWEFSTGYALNVFNACPWNYEQSFNWHFMGLITLEYAPLWYFGSIFAEKITIPYVNSLYWIDNKNSQVKKNE